MERTAFINMLLKVITLISFFGIIYLYVSNYSSNKRLAKIEHIIQLTPSIEKDSLIRILEIKDLKEQMYITQLGFLSDWLIFIVTILFAIVVIIQYVAFDSRTKQVEEKYQEQKILNDEHKKDINTRLKETKIELNASFINTFFTASTLYGGYNNLIQAFILSVLGINRCIDSKKRLEPDDNRVDNSLSGHIDQALFHAKSIFENNEYIFDNTSSILDEGFTRLKGLIDGAFSHVKGSDLESLIQVKYAYDQILIKAREFSEETETSF